jgi:hypothetical protein
MEPILVFKKPIRFKYPAIGNRILQEPVGYLVGDAPGTYVPFSLVEGATERSLRFFPHGIEKSKDYTVLRKSRRISLVIPTREIERIVF